MPLPSLRRICIAIIAATSVLIPLSALASKRVALVIGNGAYLHATHLPNPRNDAVAITGKLKELGFDVVEGYDLDYEALSPKVREFARASRDADVAIFFYAGHGIAIGGENYLVPIDAQLADSTAIDFELYPISTIIKQMSYSNGANLIFLDACRDNPLADMLSRSSQATRSIAPSGLASMDVVDNGYGTGIAFATQPGAVAMDGKGGNSPFTEALLKHLGAVNTPITSVMNRVTGDVFETTEQAQRPWFNASFTGDVYLNWVEAPAPPPPAVPVVATTGEAAPAMAPVAAMGGEDEKFMFDIARESGDPADYQIYIDAYPSGRYAAFALQGIARAQNVSDRDPAPAVAMASSEVRSFEPYSPLILRVTPQLLAAPSSDVTEQSLEMDKAKRREVQARLNAAGVDVGFPDGALGPQSRRGIQAWQGRTGLMQTGYLNASQLELLSVQTEATYVAVLAAANARRSTQTRTRAKPAPAQAQAKTTRNSNSLADTVLGRAFQDLVNGGRD